METKKIIAIALILGLLALGTLAITATMVSARIPDNIKNQCPGSYVTIRVCDFSGCHYEIDWQCKTAS